MADPTFSTVSFASLGFWNSGNLIYLCNWPYIYFKNKAWPNNNLDKLQIHV